MDDEKMLSTREVGQLLGLDERAGPGRWAKANGVPVKIVNEYVGRYATNHRYYAVKDVRAGVRRELVRKFPHRCAFLGITD